MALAVLFAALGVGVVALRNTGYGRRLAAMKDSPAASAMLGQSLIRLKLGVFMLSAAIAGLGGILMAAAAGSVSGDNFLIISSLALVMLTVVGGVTYVSGALFGGMVIGVGLSALGTTSSSLALEHPQLESIFVILGHLVALLVALTGLGVNRNPSGMVHALGSAYRPLRDARPVLYAGAVAVAVLVVANLAGLIGDWSLVLLTITVVLALPALGARLMPERVLSADVLEERAAQRRAVPELRALDRRLTTDERLELDAQLGLPAQAALRLELADDAVEPLVPASVPTTEGPVHVTA
jgi:hypothetical protein